MNSAVRNVLRGGTVIPAHPLALTAARKLDERRQRALARYYAAAGAGGIAVGVHTTQFQIRDPKIGLYKPVLAIAAEEMNRADGRRGVVEELRSGGVAESVSESRRSTAPPRHSATPPPPHSAPLVRIAGVVGPTPQAVAETSLARDLKYHAVLLSLSALKDASEQQLIDHCRAVGEVLPLVGFYLQPAAGGRLLPYAFWRRFAELPSVVAIKMAPFNRYQTIDVVRAVVEAGRDDIALYTGNDDNIILDLLTPYRFDINRQRVERRIVGGLLGHWACWTQKAVELLDVCKAAVASGAGASEELLRRNIEVTDCNAAFFDAANLYAGVIAGIHEVLRRQGLLQGIWCLDENESLSPGQSQEIDRVYRAYPYLNDDTFVATHLDEWLRD